MKRLVKGICRTCNSTWFYFADYKYENKYFICKSCKASNAKVYCHNCRVEIPLSEPIENRPNGSVCTRCENNIEIVKSFYNKPVQLFSLCELLRKAISNECINWIYTCSKKAIKEKGMFFSLAYALSVFIYRLTRGIPNPSYLQFVKLEVFFYTMMFGYVGYLIFGLKVSILEGQGRAFIWSIVVVCIFIFISFFAWLMGIDISALM